MSRAPYAWDDTMWTEVIRRLGSRQRAVLDQFGVNQTRGHPRKIVQALAAKGLLLEEVREGRDRFGTYEIHGWYMPLYVHLAWCQVCRSEPTDEEGVPHGTVSHAEGPARAD